MRKLALIFILGIIFLFPTFVHAQNNATIANMTVQLWPEYDQPSMLAIVDFQVTAATALPVDLKFNIPQDANLIAVAALAGDGSFLNTVFEGPKDEGEWQTFTVTISQSSVYRFEYYQPLSFNGNERIFSYLWDGSYAVDAFNILVLEPVDVTSFTMDPTYESIAQENGGNYYDTGAVQLAKGEQFALNLNYTKTSEALITSPDGIQPSAPVDANTPGRVSLNNSLPYIIGGLGVLLIVGGIVYYWKAGHKSFRTPRRRAHAQTENEESGGEDAYCPQCGSRAKAGDRFCRVCGARLRHKEE